MNLNICMSTGESFYVRRCPGNRRKSTGATGTNFSTSILKILEAVQQKNAITNMSKSMNMLRTRRKDNNVKPNRKLDRKSSRGMIYENEELRLKTININAEVERGQSDIKKLKRENEMLKKEIWSLRDEYDKLDKLLKEKEISFSSSSTTCTSETESCSTCSDDSDQVETSQNLENVQKTNLKNLHVEFDHLSVVPEENSTENSDRNSNRTSIPNDSWNVERNIIKPDQSYPSFETLSKSVTLPQIAQEERVPKHFFAPIKSSKSCEDNVNGQFDVFDGQNQYYLAEIPKYTDSNAVGIHPLYDNERNLGMMSPLTKSSTDLIVKMDNQNFNTLSNSSFSNGGNLEQLLNDIESISQDILKLSNPNLSYDGDSEQFGQAFPPEVQTPPAPFDPMPDNCEIPQATKPYKSELNVVLMPTAMPLIGFEKYRNIQGSLESIRSKSMENLPCQNTPIETKTTPELFYQQEAVPSPMGFVANTPNVLVSTHDTSSSDNPFYFGNATGDYFASRYNPDNYINNTLSTNIDKNKKSELCNSKTNLLEVNSEQVSSENEENLKFKPSKMERECEKVVKIDKKIEKKPEGKTPKLSIRRKVSIHFKGKKDKKNKSLDQLDVKSATPIEKKHSLFDIKFTTETKQKDNLQKAPSLESKKSALGNGLEVKASNSPDPKRNSNEAKTPENNQTPESKSSEKKGPKSASVSPERKHVHVKEDGKKSHKKHKKGDKKNRRSTISTDKFYADRFLRERSFSVCTERSNVLGLGFNSAFSMYDDCPISDRERTNSLSSCGTIKLRKMSNISNFPISGKIPWCACWGNGCL